MQSTLGAALQCRVCLAGERMYISRSEEWERPEGLVTSELDGTPTFAACLATSKQHGTSDSTGHMRLKIDDDAYTMCCAKEDCRVALSTVYDLARINEARRAECVHACGRDWKKDKTRGKSDMRQYDVVILNLSRTISPRDSIVEVTCEPEMRVRG